jgi:5'(3')-deoxyribonucleotidase
MSKSNTQMDCGEAIRLANESLQFIQMQRELKCQEWMQRYMKRDQRGFWATVFRKPPIFPTPKQAEEALHAETVMDNMYDVWVVPSAYQDIQECYRKREALAKRIIKLARVSVTGQVTISIDDVDLFLS